MNDSTSYIAESADVLVPAAVQSDYAADAVTSLAAVSDDWGTLERHSNNATVFQTYSWCSAWLSAAAKVGHPQRPLIVRVRIDGKTVLIWPLCRSVLAGCRILHALGEPATQYCDALVTSDCDHSQAVASAWKLVTSRADIDLLSLRRIRDDAAIFAIPPLAAVASNDVAPFLDLSVAAGTKHWSGRRRRELTRCRRKLSAYGEVELMPVLDPSDKIRAVDHAVTLKRAWMRRRGLWSGGYAHPAANAFTRSIAPDSSFKVFVLKAGSELAAIETGYVLDKTYWALTRSYDDRFAAMAPSHLITQQTVDHFARLGLTRYDLLPPCQPYKMDWSTGTVGVRDVLSPLTWLGVLFARTSRVAWPAIKRLLGHVALR